MASPLKATRVTGNPANPGEYQVRELEGVVFGLAFQCPCGCGGASWLPTQGEHSWKWNGDKDKPTLTPSVLQNGMVCKWHGYLTDGMWTEC